MGDVIEGFPLFPLGMVLLPTEVVPLHIFEERYKRMIGECLEEEREFGIVWMSDEGLRDVGCAAEITKLLERMEDGRINVLTRGSAPFRLLRRIDDMPYPAGDVEMLDDLAEEPDPDVADDARERYADLVDRVTDSRPAEDELAELSAYAMVATVETPPAAKQALLEQRSEGARLAAVAELFGAAMKRLDFMERASERASSNGKVRS